MTSTSRAPLLLGAAVFALLAVVGTYHTFARGNPVYYIPWYFVAGVAGPYLTLRALREEKAGASYGVAVAPIGLGHVAAFVVAYVVWGRAEWSLLHQSAIVVFPLMFFPIGVGLAFLARLVARRGLTETPSPPSPPAP